MFPTPPEAWSCGTWWTFLESHPMRERPKHRLSRLDALCLGHAGPMTAAGVSDVIERRARQSGIEAPHPHSLRHAFAHAWLASGGNEGDLMSLTGWRSRTMLQRYATSRASERARDAHRTLRAVTDRQAEGVSLTMGEPVFTTFRLYP